VELGPGADAQLAEHLVQVVVDGAFADVPAGRPAPLVLAGRFAIMKGRGRWYHGSFGKIWKSRSAADVAGAPCVAQCRQGGHGVSVGDITATDYESDSMGELLGSTVDLATDVPRSCIDRILQ
jgi:hypothetical protein